MATYRERTPTVDAMRLTSQVPPTDLYTFLGTLENVRVAEDRKGIIISTPEGEIPIAEGDWVIKDSSGRLMGTDNHSFTARYEKAEERQ